jgi:hypothetical protein
MGRSADDWPFGRCEGRRQRQTLWSMVAKDSPQFRQTGRPTHVDYCTPSDTRRVAEPPVAARSPWWTHVETRAPDEGMEPALEIWLDTRSLPAIIRLAGLLDGRTRRSLLSVVEHLFVLGIRHFQVDAGELAIGDASGASELTMFQRRTREAGGSLDWIGLDFGSLGRHDIRESIPLRSHGIIIGSRASSLDGGAPTRSRQQLWKS